jgi:CRP-like cAMP-binding protein
VLKYGSVRITHHSSDDGDVVVSVIGTGGHFGEMPFVDGGTRSEAAVVAEKTELIKIDYKKLNAYLSTSDSVGVKFYRAIATFLCGRLRITTNNLTFARQKNLKRA